jgi:uncharacterized repeat protein (TIGR03843 family)
MPAADLVTAELTLTARLTTASNATFLGSIGDAAVVYKPIAGEQPLWDFPDGCLAHREVAAHLVSEALGWNIVPRTWLRDGPFGEGMVQLWQETDPEGEDQSGRTVALIHEDTPELRRMAVFDVLVNNADRKGDHILAMSDGHRYGVDHGLTCHSEHKLRTVLWGWIGEALSTEELAGIDRVLSGLEGELGRNLDKLLTAEEFASLAVRCARLRRAGKFPAPSGEMPAVPWPLF